MHKREAEAGRVRRKGHLRGELLVVDGRLELLLVVLRRQQCLFHAQVHRHNKSVTRVKEVKKPRSHEVKSEKLS